MKKSLGSLIYIVFTLLYAEDFDYNFKVDNRTPYLKEAIVLTLELNQTNKNVVLLFNFNLKKSNTYSFQRLNIEEKEEYHDLKIRYSYLIYPLKVGKLDIEFSLIKKVTSDDSIAYSFSGDRDNVKGLVTIDSKISLAPISLNVKTLPKNTLLVGDFDLKFNILKRKAEAYEPIPLKITIDGVGYPPTLKYIIPKNSSFKYFIDKPIIKSKSTLLGTQNQAIYSMALSHNKDFNLSKINIKAFNPKTQKSYNLTIDKQIFKIDKINIDKLLDKEDYPPKMKQDFYWIKTFFSYLIIFITGYLTAIAFRWKRKEINKKRDSIDIKIEERKDKKSLLQLLISLNNPKFEKIIIELEEAIYKNQNIDLNNIKSKLNLLNN